VPGRPPLWTRRFRRHRRIAAALLAGVVVWSLSTSLRPAPPRLVPVLVAAHDLAPGVPLTGVDVTTVELASAAVPADALAEPGPVVGHLVSFPLRSGEPVLARHVVGADLLARFGPGTVATPVRLSDDAAVALVRAGDVVDVIAASASDPALAARARIVARSLPVIVVGASAGAGGGGLLGGGSAGGSGAAGVLVLATTSDQAVEIARAGVGARLSVVVRAG
jgi:Flp pilus assembly protein CpaB